MFTARRHRTAAVAGFALALAASVTGCSEAPNEAPFIERIQVWGGNLVEGEIAPVHVTVLDADGLDDIVGVRLLYAPDLFWLTSFTAASDGLFTLGITWTELEAHGVFDGRDGQSVVSVDLMVEAMDNGGNVDRLTFELIAACPPDTELCDGTCISDFEPC